MEKKIEIAIAGFGSRGCDAYGELTKEYDELKVVAVADIVPEKLEKAKEMFNLEENMCFDSAEEMLRVEKLADIMFICTQDRQHRDHAVPALEKGYDLLLEKPISPELDECIEIAEVAEKLDRNVIVCHVLRYSPFYQKIKEIISQGDIGEVVSIQAIEGVCYWHQAHSFVRGNWRNSEESSPMILQKSCHDMDILLWLAGKSCESISSFGNLYHFAAENAPEGATKNCLDDCMVKDTCPYNAEKIYIEDPRTSYKNKSWPANVLTMDLTEEGMKKALREGPYGRCVYHCDNNVVDHQVVNMQLEDGASMSFTMSAFTNEGNRKIHVMGTKGDIIGDLQEKSISVGKFGEIEREIIDISQGKDKFSGHGGGDQGIIDDLVSMFKGEKKDSLTSIAQSVESHVMALAAEESRLKHGDVITLKEFINKR